MNSSEGGWHSPGDIFNPFQLHPYSQPTELNKSSRWPDPSNDKLNKVTPLQQQHHGNAQFNNQPFSSPLSFSRHLEQAAFQLPVTPMAAFLERNEADRTSHHMHTHVNMDDKASVESSRQQSFDWTSTSSPSTNLNSSMTFSINSTPSASPTSSIYSTPSSMRQQLRVKIPGMPNGQQNHSSAVTNEFDQQRMQERDRQFEMMAFGVSYDHMNPMSSENGSRRGSDTTSMRAFLSSDMVTHATSSSGVSVGSSSTSGGPMKKHACNWPDCQKSFDKPSALKRHIRSHTGEKPFNCSWPGCTQSFSERGNLKRHQRCHTGEKPYHCDFHDCSDQFARRSHLLQHIRSKHDGSIQTRIDTSPNGTHATAHITGFNGYSKIMPVTPRRRRSVNSGYSRKQPRRKLMLKRRRGSLGELSDALREAPAPYTRCRSSMDPRERKSWIDQSSEGSSEGSDSECDELMAGSDQQSNSQTMLHMSIDPPQPFHPNSVEDEAWRPVAPLSPLALSHPFSQPHIDPFHDQHAHSHSNHLSIPDFHDAPPSFDHWSTLSPHAAAGFEPASW